MKKAVSAFALFASSAVTAALEIDFWSDPAGAIWEMYDELDFKLKSGELFTSSARRLAFTPAEANGFVAKSNLDFEYESPCSTFTFDNTANWPATIVHSGGLFSPSWDVREDQVAIVCMTKTNFTNLFEDDGRKNSAVWKASKCSLMTGFCDKHSTDGHPDKWPKNSQGDYKCALAQTAVEYANDQTSRPGYVNLITDPSSVDPGALLKENPAIVVPLVLLVITLVVLLFTPLTCCIALCCTNCCRSGPKDAYSFSKLGCCIGNLLQTCRLIPVVGPFIAKFGPDEVMTIILWVLVGAVIVTAFHVVDAINEAITVVSMLRCSIIDAVDVIASGVKVDGVIEFLGFGNNTANALGSTKSELSMLNSTLKAAFDGQNSTYYLQQVMAGYTLPNTLGDEHFQKGSLTGIVDFFANVDLANNLNINPTKKTTWSGLVGNQIVTDTTWTQTMVQNSVNMYSAAMGSILLGEVAEEFSNLVTAYIPALTGGLTNSLPTIIDTGKQMDTLLKPARTQMQAGQPIDWLINLMSNVGVLFAVGMVFLVLICAAWLGYFGLGCGFDGTCWKFQHLCKLCVGPLTILGFCKSKDDKTCSENVTDHCTADQDTCKLYPHADLRSGKGTECFMALCCVTTAIIAILLLAVGSLVIVFEPLGKIMLFIDGILINPLDTNGTLFIKEFNALAGDSIDVVPMLAAILPRGGPQNLWAGLKTMDPPVDIPGILANASAQMAELKSEATMFKIAEVIDISGQWNTANGSWEPKNAVGVGSVTLLNEATRPSPSDGRYNPARIMSNAYNNLAMNLDQFMFLTDVSDATATAATKAAYTDGAVTNPAGAGNAGNVDTEIINMFDYAAQSTSTHTKPAMDTLNTMRFPQNASDLKAKIRSLDASLNNACFRYETSCTTATNSMGFKAGWAPISLKSEIQTNGGSTGRAPNCGSDDADCVEFLWRYFGYLFDRHMYTDAKTINSTSPGSAVVAGKIYQQRKAFKDTETILKDQFKSLISSTQRENYMLSADVFDIFDKFLFNPMTYILDKLGNSAPIADIIISMMNSLAIYFVPRVLDLVWSFATMGIISMMLSLLFFRVFLHHKSMNPLQDSIAYHRKQQVYEEATGLFRQRKDDEPENINHMEAYIDSLGDPNKEDSHWGQVWDSGGSDSGSDKNAGVQV